MGVEMVYLLHFSKPYKHARHYLGSADDVNERLEAHRKGQGAILTQVAADAGITFEIARTWQGSRKEERQLKNRHNAPKLCPMCKLKTSEPK